MITRPCECSAIFSKEHYHTSLIWFQHHETTPKNQRADEQYYTYDKRPRTNNNAIYHKHHRNYGQKNVEEQHGKAVHSKSRESKFLVFHNL